MPSCLDAALVQAYRETDYIVHAQPGFVLRIDTHSAALAAHYTQHGIAQGCVITAWNPQSQPLTQAENQARQTLLEQQLQHAGWHWIRAVAAHPHNGWPAEIGCFVEGMDAASADLWGRQHAQNAVVWCGADATPSLRLLR